MKRKLVITALGMALMILPYASAYSAKKKICGVFSFGWNQDRTASSFFDNTLTDGATVLFGWYQLEPQDGKYNWTALDKLLEVSAASGKVVNIGIIPNYNSPAWIKTKGVRPITYERWGCHQGVLNNGANCEVSGFATWDKHYLDEWIKFLRAVDNHVRVSKANIGYISIVGPNTQAIEMSVKRYVGKQRTDLQASGYSVAALSAGWDYFLSQAAGLFGNIPVAITLGSVDGSDDLTRHVVDQSQKAFGDRVIFKIAFWNGKWLPKLGANNVEHKVSSLLINIGRQGGTVGYEAFWKFSDTKSAVGGTLSEALSFARQSKVDFIEIYAQDLEHQDAALKDDLAAFRSELPCKQ